MRIFFNRATSSLVGATLDKAIVKHCAMMINRLFRRGFMKRTGKALFSRLFFRAALGVLVLLTLGALIVNVHRFGQESLQMDFAAFYTAGEALNHNLSPYVNYAFYDPPIWDGICFFKHSRFLYPPLAAVLFQPMALLPYRTAKYLWMVANLICVGCSLYVTVRALHIPGHIEWQMGLAVFATTFYPLMTLLERGQVDGITLFLITLATKLIIENKLGARIVSGVLWALATILKLHCAFIVPFFFIRKRWTTIIGYAIGVLSALTISLIVIPHLTIEYFTKEFPRIARFGESGSEEMRIPASLMQPLRSSFPEGYTQKDGIMYRYESFQFISNASLVRSASAVLRKIGLNAHPSALSGFFFLALLLGVWGWQNFCCASQELDNFGEVVYWQSVWVIILLSAPLTWAMNTVWLLPLAVTFLSSLQKLTAENEESMGSSINTALCSLRSFRFNRLFARKSALKEFAKLKQEWLSRGYWAQVIGIAGLVLAWIPDPLLLLLMPIRLANLKYVFAEIFILVSLLLIMSMKARMVTDRRPAAEAT